MSLIFMLCGHRLLINSFLCAISSKKPFDIEREAFHVYGSVVSDDASILDASINIHINFIFYWSQVNRSAINWCSLDNGFFNVRREQLDLPKALVFTFYKTRNSSLI